MDFDENQRYLFLNLNITKVLERVDDISEKVTAIHVIYEKLKQESEYLSEHRQNEHVGSNLSFKDPSHLISNDNELENQQSNEKEDITPDFMYDSDNDTYYVKEGCGCYKSRNPNRTCPLSCTCSLF